MCAHFKFHWDLKNLMFLQKNSVDEKAFKDKVIAPYTKAPVIIKNQQGEIEATEMQFSIVPSWSKDPKVKFATHNARLESITEKPTWKESFKKRHCVIPIGEFIEPIYTGSMAGNMVAFGANENMLAAGLWDEWVNKQTGEVIQSFAIITTEPPSYVAEVGHDRCPIFLNQERALQWLQNGNEDPAKLVQFLQNNISDQISYQTQIHRPLKAGWEKRV